MKFIKFKNAKEASEFVGNKILEQINKKSNSILGLATGSTPILTYEFLVKDFQKNKTNWSNVTTFNLDEYIGLEPNHQQTYHYFMNDILFSHLNIILENTHFPDSKIDYDQLIKEHEGIDLQILGIGTNGHIGFNEPGSELDSLTREVELVDETIQVNANKFFNGDTSLVPKKAYSMGLSSILKAKTIILLAFGKSKQKVMEKLYKIKEFDINLPASALINHKNTIIVCDDEGAPNDL